jgi:anti-sigma factor RsiW
MHDDPAADRRRLIAALLGPGEPELTCEACFEQLDRYVDLELASADADAAVPGMRAHLAGCPACLEDHASLVAFAGSDAADEA